jgi:hypothetical protein
VRIFRRGENRGALFTKLEAVEHAQCPWVVLLDSDNTLLPSALNAICRLRSRDSDTIYCPTFAFPYYSFKSLSGLAIDFACAVRLCREGTLRRVYIINDGNYLLHRETYLESMSPLRELRRDVADVMVVNYLWLSANKRLHVLDNASYIHRIDSTSFWHQTADASRKRVLALFDRIEAGLAWDDEMLKRLHHEY